MPKKELAPLKSTVNFDPAAELTRIEAELAQIEVEAGRLARLGWYVLLAGFVATACIVLVGWLLMGALVLWGAPLTMVGAICAGYLLLRSGKVRQRADFLMQQRRETRSLAGKHARRPGA